MSQQLQRSFSPEIHKNFKELRDKGYSLQDIQVLFNITIDCISYLERIRKGRSWAEGRERKQFKIKIEELKNKAKIVFSNQIDNEETEKEIFTRLFNQYRLDNPSSVQKKELLRESDTKKILEKDKLFQIDDIDILISSNLPLNDRVNLLREKQRFEINKMNHQRRIEIAEKARNNKELYEDVTRNKKRFLLSEVNQMIADKMREYHEAFYGFEADSLAIANFMRMKANFPLFKKTTDEIREICGLVPKDDWLVEIPKNCDNNDLRWLRLNPEYMEDYQENPLNDDLWLALNPSLGVRKDGTIIDKNSYHRPKIYNEELEVWEDYVRKEVINPEHYIEKQLLNDKKIEDKLFNNIKPNGLIAYIPPKPKKKTTRKSNGKRSFRFKGII